MRIAVLGTGVVGRTLAAGLTALGHQVTVGTRDPAATLDRGDEALTAWRADHEDLGIVPFADAVVGADLVVNATNGAATLDVLDQVGESLDGRILVDVSNPLDFSRGFPPTLFVEDTDSLAEQVQAAHPRAHVVKTLNTVTADLMVRPDLLDEASTVFVSGDDADAKAVVTGLLHELGHTDVLDLGDLSTARGTEMYLALWVRAMGALGTPLFNIRVVR
jgi:8-hydroxy-5-deazaflavin:NADPH oxidoreductase